MKIRITSGGMGCDTDVWIDGERVKNCQAVKFECDGLGFATVTLRLYVDDLEIEGEAKVETTESNQPLTKAFVRQADGTYAPEQ